MRKLLSMRTLLVLSNTNPQTGGNPTSPQKLLRSGHRWVSATTLAALLCYVLFVQVVCAAKEPRFKDGELLVKFKSNIALSTATSAHERLGSRLVKRFEKSRIQVVRLREGLSTKEGLELYEKDPTVEYAEPNYRLYADDLIPDDPMFDQLWALENMGQTGGTFDVDIDAPVAWETTTGSRDIIVAVIDTGVDYTHEDLAANMWVNVAERDGTPDVDDDGNGYIDDLYGIDAFNEDSDPMDDEGHGTHVSGTIGAVGYNGVGVVGVNWDVQIMALKFIGEFGFGYVDGAIACLEYCMTMKQDHGHNIRVTNNSWGGTEYSQALYDTIQAAADADILFVAAAGNDTVDNDTSPHYPSSFNLPSIIAVAAETTMTCWRHFQTGAPPVWMSVPLV